MPATLTLACGGLARESRCVENATQTLHRLMSYAPARRWDVPPADDPRGGDTEGTGRRLHTRAGIAGQPGATVS
jgi:hypothetical protein